MAKEVNKRVTIWVNGKEVENNVKSIRAEMLKLTNQLNKTTIGSEEYIRISSELKKLKKIYDEHCASLKSVGEEIENNTGKLKDNIVAAGGFSAAVQGGIALLKKFVSATQEYVDAYATIDDAMSAVQKTTGMTRDEVESLRNSLQNIDTRTSTEELLKIAEIGGRLGLAKEDIESFARSVDVANVALGDSFQGGAEEIATVLGKIRGAFQDTKEMGIEDAFNAIGSALNSVGATCAATEGNVAQFAQRLGALPDAMKPSVQEAIGLGAAFENSSINAEIAATAYGQLMTKAAANIGKFAAAMGEPVEEMRELLNTNPVEFMLRFAESMRGMPADELGAQLKDLKLNAVGVQEAIGAMSSQTDEFRRILEVSATEFANGTSMMEEFGTVNNNAAAQLEKAKNAVQDAKAALGEELIPLLTDLTKGTASSIKVVTEVIKWGTQHKGVLLSLAAAYAVILVAKNRKLIADKAEAAQMRITNALKQKAINTAVKKKVVLAQETAATEAKRLAEMKARLETLKGVAADNQLRAVLQQETVAKTANAAATRAQAQAQRLLNTATKSTPWGLIAAGITAAVVLITSYVDKLREASKATKELNKKIGEESSYAEYLIGVLKNTEEGSSEYKKALEKLKELYPDIIQAHTDEHGKLTNLDEAYRDIVASIENKIAAQLKEEAVTEALNEKLTTTREKLTKINKELSAQGLSDNKRKEVYDIIQSQIPKLLSEGKSISDATRIVSNNVAQLGVNVDVVERNIFKTGTTIRGFISDIAQANVAATDAINKAGLTYDPLIKKPASTTPTTNEVQHNPNDPEHCQCAECKNQRKKDAAERAKEEEKKWKTFQEKVASLRNKAAQENLDGWEKVKAQTTAKYDELIKDAEQFGKKGVALAKQLEQEKVEAVAAAGQKYLEKHGKTLEDFSRKILDWGKDLMPESGNEVLDALLGTEQKWAQRFTDAQKQMQDLLDLRKLFVADNIDTTSLDALINKLGDEMNGMADMEAKDIQKTLEKYQAQTDDFIKAEQKSITDATLTERQRQKNAIEEKYRLEIEHIEKTIAARIAAYGKDDPEVKQLRKKIKLLNQLKNQQLANVSSGQKTIWQQLIEFDWSKISDNWQDALDLMGQGLQEFASAAFDIYGSIAQIQNNLMEAELQKAQETYDAKSAALKRQLNQGVISQKAYDAKMQKLNEEKEKKEKKLKHEQFAREKTASIIQATISGIVAIMQGFSQAGPIGGAILAAIQAVITAAQIAAIASQPNPYAKGSYIRGPQLALMGEEGDEWVASNKLLRDKKTAGIIEALDQYQKGNRNALRGITFNAPDPKIMSQAVSGNGSTFAPSNQVTNNYYPSDNGELLKELRQMNEFLKDPNNRRAYISRKIQLEFDEQEENIRSMARL
jgi:tubulin-specific chaperone A